jgi:hypothetical protein
MKIVNTEAGFAPDMQNTDACVLAVLTQDDAGKYAVYVGVVRNDPSRRAQHAERVASGGRKLVQWQVARGFFPFLTEEMYRAGGLI